MEMPARDMPSATNSVSSGPLGTKSFGFLRLANRAISLCAILAVEGMTFRAVRLERVEIRFRCGFSKRIFPGCSQSEMINVNTIPVSAGVMNNHASRDISIIDPVNHSMNAPIELTEKEVSVAVFVELSPKENTLALLC